MNRRSIVRTGVIVVLVSVSSTFAGTTYSWKTSGIYGVNGNWQTPADWNASGYPGSADTASLPRGAYTITSSEDVSIGSMTLAQFSVAAQVAPTIDMNGHSFTCTGQVNLRGAAMTSASYNPNYLNLVLKNGTFSFPGGLYPGGQIYNSFNLAGGFTVGAGATLSAKLNYYNAGSRIIVRDGGVWNVSGGIVMGDRVCKDSYGLLYVTGAGSRLVMDNKGIQVRGDHAGLCVENGGVVTNVSTLSVGYELEKANCSGNGASDDTFIEVFNGQIYANSDINMSWQTDAKLYPRLVIRGADSYVEAGNDFIFRNNLGGKMIFDLSGGAFTNSEGVLRAPLRVKNTFKPYDAGAYAYGTTQIIIRGYDWMREHGGEEIPLIEQTAENTNYQRIIDNGWMTLEDFPEELFDGLPELFIEDNGRKLMLRIPDVRNDTPIDFSASVAVSSTTSNMTFTITGVSYGGTASSATVTALIGRNADFSDAVEHTLLAGVSDSPTWVKTADAGTFPQHTPYYARVIFTNNRGGAATNDLEFTSGGYPETFTWASAQNGFWQDTTKWTCPAQSFSDAPTCPHAEDTVASLNAAINSSFTIYFNDDAAVGSLGSVNGRPTFDLNGHDFSFTGITLDSWYGYSKHDETLPYATVTFKNGTLACTGITLGAPGVQGHHAGLVFDNCTFTGPLSWMCNESRIWVQNGAIWTNTAHVTMNTHTAGNPWSQIIVRGEGSKITNTNKNFYVRGNCAGLFVENGGAVEANYFAMGGTTDNLTNGSLASTNTLVSLDNGTLDVYGFTMGWTADVEVKPQLVIKGTNSAIRCETAFSIHEKTGSRICFEIPENGYNATPVTAKNVQFQSHAGTDYGALRVEIAAKDWMKRHYGASIPLVALTDSCPTQLGTLRDALVLTDVQAAKFPGHAFLTVSDDGRTLLFNAPKARGTVLVFR